MIKRTRKFIFFYLNTGAGHISAAKVLKAEMERNYPGVEIVLRNGFGRRNIFGRFAFEIFYNLACNYFKGAFPLVYDLGQYRFFQTFVNRMMFGIAPGLRRIIEEEGATDVVSFHFGLTPQLNGVIRKLGRKVNITEIVTDPYTVPDAWFYERNMDYLVYSDEARSHAIERCGIRPERVRVIPFLMNEKYRTSYTPEQARQKRAELGLDPDRKMVLMVGGGEGLPGANEIIKEFIVSRAPYTVAVVCGKDRAKFEALDLLRRAYPKMGLHVYGFIDYLDELVKVCDCAVIKAGPATLLEMLECRKPVIICKYIHNQELGNMRFAVRNGVGWFIQNPHDIYLKINEILSGGGCCRTLDRNFGRIRIDTDASVAARILMDK